MKEQTFNLSYLILQMKLWSNLWKRSWPVLLHLMVFDPWFVTHSTKILLTKWILTCNHKHQRQTFQEITRFKVIKSNKTQLYIHLDKSIKGKAYALSFIKEELHRSGWCSHTSIFLASDFTPQLDRVTVYSIVYFFSLFLHGFSPYL